jgi:hypothetical protein
MALPGSALTASALEACVAAIKSEGCTVATDESGPCSFSVGTLAAGTTCAYGLQCESDLCTMGASSSVGGAPTCGTCAPIASAGQTCGDDTACGPGLLCEFTATGTGTCLTVTSVGAGQACDEVRTQCQAGLYCNGGTCAATGKQGDPCTTDAACAAPLVCPTLTGAASTCQNAGQAGATCGNNLDCIANLVCSPTTRQCQAVTWVAAGQPCNETALCLIGSCGADAVQSQQGNTCPTVIPDGQPCTPDDQTHTCDSFATCIGGTCVLGAPSCP